MRFASFEVFQQKLIKEAEKRLDFYFWGKNNVHSKKQRHDWEHFENEFEPAVREEITKANVCALNVATQTLSDETNTFYY